jgi:hypothetical protein
MDQKLFILQCPDCQTQNIVDTEPYICQDCGSEKSPEAILLNEDQIKELFSENPNPNLENSELLSAEKLIYDTYKSNSDVPIECVVNVCLLFNGVRRMIQFDKYLYSEQTWKNIEQFVHDQTILRYVDVVQKGKNIVLYLKDDQEVSSVIEEGGEIFDNEFYQHCEYNTDKTKQNISRVSINVIGPVDGEKLLREANYIGQLLVMECSSEELLKSIQYIYARYEDYKKYVWEIDVNLQLTFEVYSKYGVWEDNPFYKTQTLVQTV